MSVIVRSMGTSRIGGYRTLVSDRLRGRFHVVHTLATLTFCVYVFCKHSVLGYPRGALHIDNYHSVKRVGIAKYLEMIF